MNNVPQYEVCGHCNQVISSPGTAVVHHVQTIEKLYGFSFKEIKQKTKIGHIAYARNHFWLLLCVEASWSYPRIARLTGHDHTSVLSGIRWISREFFGTPLKSSLFTITKAYWLAVGLSEEEANAKAEERAPLRGSNIHAGTRKS